MPFICICCRPSAFDMDIAIQIIDTAILKFYPTFFSPQQEIWKAICTTDFCQKIRVHLSMLCNCLSSQQPVLWLWYKALNPDNVVRLAPLKVSTLPSAGQVLSGWIWPRGAGSRQVSAGLLQELPQERWRKSRGVYLLTFPGERMADLTWARTSFTARNSGMCA